MEAVKKTNDYQIFRKRSGRYAVRGNDKKWVNGEDKLKVLLAEGLVKAPPKKPAPEPEAEAAAE